MLAWKEYKGFKYAPMSDGMWWLLLPSGYKSMVEAATEDELKARIDALATK